MAEQQQFDAQAMEIEQGNVMPLEHVPDESSQQLAVDVEQVPDESSQQIPVAEAQPSKLFVARLPKGITEEAIQAYFSQYGTVEHVSISEKNGQKMSFCHVTFASASDIDAVQAKRPHSLQDQQVDTRRAVPKEMNRRRNIKENTTQLFIARLDSSVKEDDLKQYFGKFGVIRSIRIKGSYGFVDFSDSDVVDKLVYASEELDFNGSTIKIDKSAGGNNNKPRSDSGYRGREETEGGYYRRDYRRYSDRDGNRERSDRNRRFSYDDRSGSNGQSGRYQNRQDFMDPKMMQMFQRFCEFQQTVTKPEPALARPATGYGGGSTAAAPVYSGNPYSGYHAGASRG